MSTLAVRFHRGGIYLPQLKLWLDPHEPQTGADKVFVSHAHSDHTALHREVILSAPTSRLMHARLGGEWIEHVLPFGQPAEFNGGARPYQITLLPAGHIFGSAMAWFEAGGSSLLYTGDFKLRHGLSAEPCDPIRARGADLLIMETTYGRPAYRFPATADVMRGVIRFCREALDNEETPALLGYSLGKSQEILCGLSEAGLPIMLHGTVHKLTQIYEKFGQSFPAYDKWDPEAARGKVLLCPPSAANSALLRKLGRVRTAVLTGWAVDPNCRFRYQVDAAFPLSDHADFDDLVEFVRQVEPKKIFTLHGFAADFAQTLRDLGYDAQALSEEDQLALPLAFTKVQSSKLKARHASTEALLHAASIDLAKPRGEASASHSDPDAKHRPFAQFAATCAQIGATPKKLEKTRLLAEYLRPLDPSALARVAVWFTGHAFPPAQNKVLQLGWAVIRDALCAVAGLDHSAFGQVYLKHSDLGETAFEILRRQATGPDDIPVLGSTRAPRADERASREQSKESSGTKILGPGEAPSPTREAPVLPALSLTGVGALFDELHSALGPLAKAPILARALRASTAPEGKYLVKILTGDLRIGLKEGLVEEAIAQAFGAELADVKNSNLLVGNIAQTAVLAAEKRLGTASLVPFRPLKFMLASPEESAAAIWARVAEWSATAAEATVPAGDTLFTPEELSASIQSAPVAWIEDKYDGIRCQLHKVGTRVALYSRDLKEITATFFDLADAVAAVPHDFVLDGEIVAMRDEQALPFSDLQKRLGRREGDLFLRDEIPIQFVAFDLLWRNGQSLLEAPLHARRPELERLLPPGIRLAQTVRVRSVEEIEAAFTAARARGNEGLMIKDPASVYSPGRRGLAWLKLKKAYASLDCVVVGAEYGHGKRKQVLSDYTFAVRDDVTGELKTIGKAYSGLTDVEIARLTEHFLGTVIAQKGRYHSVQPDTVLEIAFDAIQPSDRHSSGLAMRFPRIVRIRADKTAAEIDTLSMARRLVKG